MDSAGCKDLGLGGIGFQLLFSFPICTTTKKRSLSGTSAPFGFAFVLLKVHATPQCRTSVLRQAQPAAD